VAIPITDTNPTSGTADFVPLEKIIGEARIVAMGEATHGTREFFQLKHRMLEFLVERVGFTVFAIEANWPESLAVNDYVLNGKGDPAQALAGLYFWTWDTEEVLQMIEWMHNYNQDPRHRKKIKFLGFDMQATEVAVSNVIAFLQKVDPDEARAGSDALAPLQDWTAEWEYTRKPADFHRKTAESINLMLANFDKSKIAYVNSSSVEEWALARHNLEIVNQAEQWLIKGQAPSARDAAMAANVKWILDNEPQGTKIMLWAHNAHVAAAPVGNDESMGANLRKMYGRDFVVCGFSFDHGSFQAIEPKHGLSTFSVGSAPPDSLDGTLAATGIQIFAVDLRTAPSGVVGDWLNKPQRMREVGALYDEKTPDVYFKYVYPHSYDVLFFVQNTKATHENAKPAEISPDAF
jgi:erythromycin esterase